MVPLSLNRRCLMGSGCDMFSYNYATKMCKLMPHNPIKGVQNLIDILARPADLTQVSVASGLS